METRDQRKAIINSAVKQFLDHLEEDFDEDDSYGDIELGSVVIAAEITMTKDSEGITIPTYYCSNENGIWQRGFFEILTDYKKIDARPSDLD